MSDDNPSITKEVRAQENRIRFVDYTAAYSTAFGFRSKSKSGQYPDKSGSASVRTYLPTQRVAYFAGRDAEIKTIQSRIGASGGRGQLITVAGPAGIGKTALALEYAYRFGNQYSSVVYAKYNATGNCLCCYGIAVSKASSKASVSENAADHELAHIPAPPTDFELDEMLRELELRFLVASESGQLSGIMFNDAVLEALKRSEGWLLVLDDIVNPREILTNARIPLERGNVIAVVRPSDDDESRTADIVLKTVPRAHAVRYVKSRLQLIDKEGDAAAALLVDAMEGHPFSLNLATAYAESRGITVEQLLQELSGQDSRKDVPKSDRFTLVEVANLAIRSAEIAMADADILGVIACLNGEYIEKALFDSLLLHLTLGPNVGAEKALIESGLLQPSPEGDFYTIHPTIHQLIRYRCGQAANECVLKYAGVFRRNLVPFDIQDFNTGIAYRLQINAIVMRLLKLNVKSRHLFDMLCSEGRCWLYSGNHGLAYSYLTRAFEMHEEVGVAGYQLRQLSGTIAHACMCGGDHTNEERWLLESLALLAKEQTGYTLQAAVFDKLALCTERNRIVTRDRLDSVIQQSHTLYDLAENNSEPEHAAQHREEAHKLAMQARTLQQSLSDLKLRQTRYTLLSVDPELDVSALRLYSQDEGMLRSALQDTARRVDLMKETVGDRDPIQLPYLRLLADLQTRLGDTAAAAETQQRIRTLESPKSPSK